MSIHNFAIDAGQIVPTQVDGILNSFRSDVEQRHTPLAIHNNESADIRMARAQAREIVNVSGAEVKVFLRTDNADHDAVWDEDPDPTYWNPVFLKGFFAPRPMEAELKQWGAEVVNKTEISFDLLTIQESLSRILRAGDVIQLQYNASMQALEPKNYRILNATPDGNFRYTWLYLKCQLETLTADIAVRPEDDMPSQEHIRTGGQYRESL